MPTLTISDAARRCGVTRRTLQRAIQRGRLGLTPDHRLTLAALQQAGYDPATAQRLPTQERVTGTTQVQEMSQRLAQVIERLERLITLLEAQHVAATPQRQARRRCSDAPAAHLSADAATAPPYDPAKFVLGRLCPKGHAFGTTGMSLRRRHNQSCVTCATEQQRERRKAQREGQG